MARRLLLLLLLVAAFAVLVHRRFVPPEQTSHFAFGEGPDIVMVHGLGSDVQHWLPTARLLARRHRVTLVELPGHGLSPMPVPFSLEQAAAVLDRSIRESTERPVILVGHSLGGLVAAMLALQHPERVRGLVLVETALKPQLPASERARMMALLELEYETVVRQSYLDFARDSLQGEQLYAQVAAMQPSMVKQWIRLAWTADLSAQMRKLQPILLAVLAPHSWEPKESWPQAAKALGYDRVPNVRPVRIEGCGHFVMLDRPAALAELIERFASTPDGEAVASGP